mmetsp:Transcript_22137/g.64935  ORF Transcript_22137/g.64935 Transcript_22137/m.64935 type:complete len:432 (-) Transcript_22137:62-1357(-)
MVWGPGTFGYSPLGLQAFRATQCPGINPSKVRFDTDHHGRFGGDNFMEGNLDTHMISAFGMNVSTLVSNTNASLSTEEGDGFGVALLDFVTGLANRAVVPHVLSLSLGSLSAYSCDLLCAEAAKTRKVSRGECEAYLQSQRQVCMFKSEAQVARINHGLMALGLRGVSVLGSSGDGGSHWSFGPFRGAGRVPSVLNEVGCAFSFPIFPSPSPYMASVGGTAWEAGDPRRPVAWEGSGGGFSWQFGRPEHQEAAVAAYLSRTAGAAPVTCGRRGHAGCSTPVSAACLCLRRLATGRVVQCEQPRLPRHVRRRRRGDKRVGPHRCGHLLAAHRCAPQRRLAAAGAARATHLRGGAGLSRRGVRRRRDGQHKDVLRDGLPRNQGVGPGDRLGAAPLAGAARALWLRRVDPEASGGTVEVMCRGCPENLASWGWH